MAKSMSVSAFELQQEPSIIVAAVPGQWLLEHSTPSWRIKDPMKGFQRIVKEQRARDIALAVLNQGRTFPNAIVLATNARRLTITSGQVALPGHIKFLVVDGQHRLWAQKFAEHEATYACVIHTGLTEVEMARLFLEINDNQKRVPSSLRWDLVRLVRPDDDPAAIKAAELVYELATDSASALLQRIDLTGEQGAIELKQGSVAPELKTLVSTKKAGFKALDFEKTFEILCRYLAAARSVDPDQWRSGESPLTKPRVLRGLLRLLPDIVVKHGKPAETLSAQVFAEYLSRIDRDSLSAENIRAIQGSAGIKQIYDHLRHQVRVA
jgi:DGQHR domain-containing protein